MCPCASRVSPPPPVGEPSQFHRVSATVFCLAGGLRRSAGCGRCDRRACLHCSEAIRSQDPRKSNQLDFLRKTLVEPVSPMHRGVFFVVSYRTDWLLNVHLRSGREQVLSGRQAPVQHEASHPICEREFRTTSHSRSLRSKLFYNVGCTPGFHVPLRSRVPYSSPLADILDPLVQHPWERSKSLWLTVACVLSERRL